jgi:hypothetical protein
MAVAKKKVLNLGSIKNKSKSSMACKVQNTGTTQAHINDSPYFAVQNTYR